MEYLIIVGLGVLGVAGQDAGDVNLKVPATLLAVLVEVHQVVKDLVKIVVAVDEFVKLPLRGVDGKFDAVYPGIYHRPDSFWGSQRTVRSQVDIGIADVLG